MSLTPLSLCAGHSNIMVPVAFCHGHLWSIIGTGSRIILCTVQPFMLLMPLRCLSNLLETQHAVSLKSGQKLRRIERPLAYQIDSKCCTGWKSQHIWHGKGLKGCTQSSRTCCGPSLSGLVSIVNQGTAVARRGLCLCVIDTVPLPGRAACFRAILLQKHAGSQVP